MKQLFCCLLLCLAHLAVFFSEVMCIGTTSTYVLQLELLQSEGLFYSLYLPVFSPVQSFLSREKLAMEPVYFLPVFLLTVLVAVAHQMAFGTALEHGLKIP